MGAAGRTASGTRSSRKSSARTCSRARIAGCTRRSPDGSRIPNGSRPAAPGSPADLALHWSAAGNAPEALVASVEASRAATRVHAYADAFRQAERALALWDRVPDAAERLGQDHVELLRESADGADLAGLADRAVELASQALDLVDERRDPIRAGLIHARLGFYRWLTGESQAMIEEHQRAIALIPAEPPTIERASVVGGLASALMPAGHYRESRELCEEASRPCGRPGRTTARRACSTCSASTSSGWATWTRGSTTSGSRSGWRGRPAPDAIVSQHNLCFFLGQTDRFEEGLRSRRGARNGPRVGLERRYGAGLRASAGDILHRAGRWDEADEVTRRGSNSTRTSRAGSTSSRRGRCSRGPRRRDLAQEAIAAAAGGPAHDIDADVRAYLLRRHGRGRLLDGRPAEALPAVEDWLAEFAGRTSSSCSRRSSWWA